MATDAHARNQSHGANTATALVRTRAFQNSPFSPSPTTSHELNSPACATPVVAPTAATDAAAAHHPATPSQLPPPAPVQAPGRACRATATGARLALLPAAMTLASRPADARMAAVTLMTQRACRARAEHTGGHQVLPGTRQYWCNARCNPQLMQLTTTSTRSNSTDARVGGRRQLLGVGRAASAVDTILH